MEITFYGRARVIEHVTVSNDLYLRLARSEFSKIGKSRNTAITIDGEKAKLSLVSLSNRVRTNLERFVICFIAEEVQRLIERAGTRPTGREVEPFLKDLASLLQILRVLSRGEAVFLQRA